MSIDHRRTDKMRSRLHKQIVTVYPGTPLILHRIAHYKKVDGGYELEIPQIRKQIRLIGGYGHDPVSIKISVQSY